MAKKLPKPEDKVKCMDCKYCPGIIVNHLVDCDNKQANSGGYKKGCWEHVCKHFQKK